MPDVAKPDDINRLSDPKELAAFVKRAESGDRTTLPMLRELLQTPKLIGLFGGDLAATAQRSFIKAIGGDNLGFKESVAKKMEMMRAELAGPDPTPVERLLVERVVACWLQVQDADTRYAQATGLSRQWLTLYMDRMDRANKRYLAALKTLAMVRKLAVPVLQLNIAKKQTNIASGTVVTDKA